MCFFSTASLPCFLFFFLDLFLIPFSFYLSDVIQKFHIFILCTRHQRSERFSPLSLLFLAMFCTLYLQKLQQQEFHIKSIVKRTLSMSKPSLPFISQSGTMQPTWVTVQPSPIWSLALFISKSCFYLWTSKSCHMFSSYCCSAPVKCPCNTTALQIGLWGNAS